MYGIIINSKECAAEDESWYFICLSQQKEKGIHYEYFFTVSTESGRRNPSPDPAAFKNGYADTIYENRYISGKRRMVLDPLCSCSSCCSKDKKNRLCGSLVPDLRGDRYKPASQKYSGKTKAFCGNRSSHPYDHQTEGFFFSVIQPDGDLVGAVGNASDAPEENWNPGSSPGSAGGIFQIVSWCPLSNRCPGRVRCCAGGKLAGCVGCEDEAGKSISLITDVEK